MQRKPLLCANWKMFRPPDGWDATDSPYRSQARADIVIFPTHLHITKCIKAKMLVGAQYGRPEPEGAFTGDVSMQMLKAQGCSYALCGHSERRQNHGETDIFIAEQIIAALEAGLHPILCIGETKEEYDKGKTQSILKRQLSPVSMINSLPAVLSSVVSIAYEPVWAIGSGINALPADIQNIHTFIRSLLPEQSQKSTRILYGGSVNELNASGFLAHEDIDGLLVGACSLEVEKFTEIMRSIS